MNHSIGKLLEIASDPIVKSSQFSESDSRIFEENTLADDLLKLLLRRNGFYAFESALLVRPITSTVPPLGIVQWNKDEMWKTEYRLKRNLSELLFFAEDIFGTQFCLSHDNISSFEPESGELKYIASNLDDWAAWILEDYKVRTGWPLAHIWQKQHGPISPGTKLLPKVPLILGGKIAVEQMYEVNDIESMRFRADIANQLANCPDGTKVVIKLKH